MIGFRRTSHATGVALLCLLAILAATARAGEPAGSAANVVYPVDYTAQKARLFEEIDLPLITPLPAGTLLARRYCAGGQARLLTPRIDGNRLRAVVYVPPLSHLCAEVVALSPAHLATAANPDGLEPIDLERDQAELERIIQRVGPLGAASGDAESGLPAWINYLMVLLGFAGLVLAVAYGILHQVKRLRELSGLVQRLQQEAAQHRRELSELIEQLQQEQAQQRTVGFVLKALRVESAPEEGGADAKIMIHVSDGHREQSEPTTKRRADILRELLQQHPDPLSRFSPNEDQELINGPELGRLRKDLAKPLGELLAFQLIKNSANHVSLNPTLYCPPATSPRADA